MIYAALALALVINGVVGQSAWADPPSSVLQGVVIKTSSGTINGFTAWSTDKLYRLNVQKTEERHSDNFIDEKPTQEEIKGFIQDTYALPIYFDAYLIQFPKRMLVTTKKPLRYLKHRFSRNPNRHANITLGAATT